jgi:hypothetical protein
MKHNEPPIYRVLHPVILSSDGQIYGPGAIVDLSHLTSSVRKQLVARGLFETADGEPANIPAKLADGTPNPKAPRVAPCSNCP